MQTSQLCESKFRLLNNRISAIHSPLKSVISCILLSSACQQVSYCEEQVDCRRVIIMSHFGERAFTEQQCHKTCDNCQNSDGAEHTTRDMSQVSCIGHIIKLVHRCQQKATLWWVKQFFIFLMRCRDFKVLGSTVCARRNGIYFPLLY